MFNSNNFIAKLSQLTNINCGTYNPSGVLEVAKTVEKWFIDLGFSVQLISVGDKVGPCLVATNKPNAPSFDALLIGHLDTVYNENIASKYPLRVEGNKVYGLGSIDMKSGLLQGIEAVKQLNKDDLDKLSLCFIYNSDEEISSIYSESLIAEYGKKSKCVLVLEAPEGGTYNIVNKRKGIARYDIEFIGVAAHASMPQDGVNAVNELANFILALKPFESKAKDTTYNVAPILVGGPTNVIAPIAKASFEVRFLSKDDYLLMDGKIKELVSNPLDKKVKIKLTQTAYKPPMNNAVNSTWIEDLVVASGKKLGITLNKITSGGGSDGNFVSSIGIPTIDGLGPYGEFLHNAEFEHLMLDSVEPRINLLKQILLDLLEKKS
jgi:glutamate carboxypeptidase